MNSNSQKNTIKRLELTIDEKQTELKFMRQSLQRLNQKYQETLKDMQKKDQFVFNHFTCQDEIKDIERIAKIYKEMIEKEATWRDYIMDQR